MELSWLSRWGGGEVVGRYGLARDGLLFVDRQEAVRTVQSYYYVVYVGVIFNRVAGPFGSRVNLN